MGFNDFLKNMFGKKSDKDVKGVMPLVAEILGKYDELRNTSANGLRKKSEDLKLHIRKSF